MIRKTSFSAIANADTRLLILGSLPGERSLAQQQYYAHPRNSFWYLVGIAIGCDLETMPYAERLAALLEHHIGLWDVIASAKRQGSLDTAIREAAHNPLADLVATLPALRAVAFNGSAAARTGRKLLGASGMPLIDLPSSSPAFAAMPLARKAELWRPLGDFVC